MKKLLLTLTAIAVSVATMYGQGRIGFDNLGTGNAITVGANNQGASGGAAGANLGANYSIQLLWAPQATYADQAAFLAAVLGQSAAFPFFGVTGGSPTTDGAGLFDGGAVPVPVGAYTVAARAWFNGGQYATYDAAFAGARNTGWSAFQNIASTAPPTPSEFTAFPSFQVSVIPEPSTLALAGLGAAALLLLRRRK
jgi:hypothetical protein